MKKLLLLISLFLFADYLCVAQTQSKDERLQALKMAYITKELSLTPEEAQQFWPVYNQYFAEVKQAREKHPDDEIGFEEDVLNIRKKYKPNFKTVLKDETRVNKIFTAERGYRELLRRELQNRQKFRKFDKQPQN